MTSHKPSPLHPCLRLALLATTTLVGLAAAPTQGADGTLGRERPPVSLSGAEVWSLRPTQVSLAVVRPDASTRDRPATGIPEARRNVRMVYPALVEAR
ncbi:hypothetical protein [Methylobacterium oxalidis]|uniref:Uncharacterized protein n=1 Tax=Methylobacterium oxalidis TaxID=944322 RepID=A0A512JC37_9HYPH|nr:hypothetical protein [Methylobacterium oxalidis]GEP07465.1 hypothetical protein MOX02_55030 [Methylobacterium oxalidis]GJE34132.1 hypothetical protein LDDCCGHA_4338 [Methylobacterium oxalidis]GLS64521.1 hypothetical protein GCM10007888_29020 [Methylobacterium oxalidis]